MSDGPPVYTVLVRKFGTAGEQPIASYGRWEEAVRHRNEFRANPLNNQFEAWIERSPPLYDPVTFKKAPP